MKIVPAKFSQAQEINQLTIRAFQQYKEQLNDTVNVKALKETEQDVISDIKNHIVLVAIRHGKIIGCIRVEQLTEELAYIFRFSVAPEESGTGIGSSLLAYAIEECEELNVKAIALHTNTKYYKLARYYYGKNFFVHSTTLDRGYIRALFIKELSDKPYDIMPALLK